MDLLSDRGLESWDRTLRGTKRALVARVKIMCGVLGARARLFTERHSEQPEEVWISASRDVANEEETHRAGRVRCGNILCGVIGSLAEERFEALVVTRVCIQCRMINHRGK